MFSELSMGASSKRRDIPTCRDECIHVSSKGCGAGLRLDERRSPTLGSSHRFVFCQSSSLARGGELTPELGSRRERAFISETIRCRRQIPCGDGALPGLAEQSGTGSRAGEVDANRFRSGACPGSSAVFADSRMASGGGTRDLEPKGATELEESAEENESEENFHARESGLFLRMILGPINVRAARKDGRFKVKEEYNAYRDRTAIMFLAFPVFLLILKNKIWNGCFPALPVQVYQAWLLFFYTSLALRENILRINGSDIRPWWVYHHYCAMVMALVSLTWGIQGHPLCIRKQQGVRLFLGWAVMQGVAMLLQNRYQRQRLYTRIALGKAGRMDVVWGETAGVTGQLWVLYPLLFILQGFQFFIGILLLKTAIVEDESEWQMVVCGFLLILMACGNFANTVATLVAKAKVKSKMRNQAKQQ